MIPQYNWQFPDKIIKTDACLVSCGGWSEGKFFYSNFPPWLKKVKGISINELETMAVIIALKLWRQKIRNKHLLMHSDKQATVEIINTGKAKNKFAQECLREVCYITAKCNAVVKMVYKPGVDNRISDFLSRIPLDECYKEKFEAETRDFKIKQWEVRQEDFIFSHNW